MADYKPSISKKRPSNGDVKKRPEVKIKVKVKVK